MGGAAAAEAGGACLRQQQQQQQQQKARARSAVVRARRLCVGRVHMCACARMRRSEPQPSQAAPERMQLSSRSKQLSIVLDPA
eukprot:6083673-Prymnesium_polylepis.1